MSTFRFSLRWLLLFVAFVALGIVSLRYASPTISNCLSVAWLLLLMVTVLGVIYRRENQRAFWLGCCIFGWSFAGYDYLSRSADTALDRIVESSYDAVSWKIVDESATNQSFSAFYYESFPPEAPFKAALGVLLGIIAAVLGGLSAQWFHATQGCTAQRGRQA